MKTSLRYITIGLFSILGGILLVSSLVWAADSKFIVGTITKDNKRSVTTFISNGGGMMKLTTKEKYRVYLHVPKGAATSQDITMSALKKSPFPGAKKLFKGTGISLEPIYRNLSVRYFSKPAWLVFDFSKKKIKNDRSHPLDYCRADLPTFSVFPCMNATGATFEHDKLFMLHVDPEYKDEVSLAPVYKLKKNLYAVEVLYKGVYIPRFLTKEEAVTFTEDIAKNIKRPTASTFIEAGRTLEYFDLPAGTAMREKLASLKDMIILTPDQYAIGAMVTNALGVAESLAKLQSKITPDRIDAADWTKYFAMLGVGSRTDPSLFPSPTGDAAKTVIEKRYQRARATIKEKLESIGGVYQIWKWTKTAKQVSWLNFFAPTAYAQSADWVDAMVEDIRSNLNDLISQTSDFDSLLLLAEIAFEMDQEDLGDSALDKAAQGLANAINAASAGSGGGGVSTCDLVKGKTLANFGQNDCASGGLFDLAAKAFSIEENELGNKALSKAGVQ